MRTLACLVVDPARRRSGAAPEPEPYTGGEHFLHGDGDVVEETETPVEVVAGVVARGPDERKAGALNTGLRRPYCASRGQGGDLEKTPILAHAVYQRSAVAQEQVGNGTGRRLHEIGDILYARENGGYPVRALTVDGVVPYKERIVVDYGKFLQKITWQSSTPVGRVTLFGKDENTDMEGHATAFDIAINDLIADSNREKVSFH